MNRNKLHKYFDTDFIFYTCLILVAFLLFINGLESFISSSEFWSIYLSQKIISGDSHWNSVYLKPFFHLLLSAIYLIDLNDFYHIVTAKLLFALNGLIQFILVFAVLQKNLAKRFLNLALAAFIFSAPFFISHMNQVRSDQLSLTFFLLFIYISIRPNKLKKWTLVPLVFFFPIIAFKHIYFSILSLLILPWKEYAVHFKGLTALRKLILVLVVINFLAWGLVGAAKALHYFLDSYESELAGIRLLIPWIKTEWFYIYFSFLPYLFKDFRIYLGEKKLNYLLPMQVLILMILLLHPQKLAFFIASFLPVLYLSSVLFCQFLSEKKIIAFRFVFCILLIAGVYSIFTAQKYYHVFTINNPQLITIDRISNIVSQNDLTYLDGMGILPRAKNIGCFVSPNDNQANKYCIESLNKKTPEAVIVTNRLMSLSFDFPGLTKNGYTYVGPNLYLRNDIIPKFKKENYDWPAPAEIFSYEQIY